MTLMTMISTATPKVTPSTEIKVMTETKVLLGRRYRSASSSSNGNPDMRGKLVGTRWDVNALGAGTRHARYPLPPPAGLLSELRQERVAGPGRSVLRTTRLARRCA